MVNKFLWLRQGGKTFMTMNKIKYEAYVEQVAEFLFDTSEKFFGRSPVYYYENHSEDGKKYWKTMARGVISRFEGELEDPIGEE